MSEGKVFLVGAGPGDPGLITVRGRELLDSADAIVYDALANPALLPADAETSGHPQLYFVGKRGRAGESVSQEDVNRLIVKLARDGLRVVRLKGGDPFVFGRGSEEAIACSEAGIPCEVVPGITAGIGAPTYAGIPVTHRGMSSAVTLVSASDESGRLASTTDWRALAKAGGTIVLYATSKNLGSSTTALLDGGLAADTPAAAIQWGTHTRQRTVMATLGTVADSAVREELKSPVVVVIGWSVLLRDEIAWFEKRPLFGKKILVSRSAQDESLLTSRLREAGAEVLETSPPSVARLDLASLRDELERLPDYSWLVFATMNSVALFWEQLLASGRDARSLAGLKIAAVGPATIGALLERGIAVDVIPERFDRDGLLEALRSRDDLRGARTLLLSAEGALDSVRDGLVSLGMSVATLEIYRSVPELHGADRLRRLLEQGEIHLVTVTSTSAVSALVAAVGPEAAASARVASIGPVSSAAAREAGLTVAVEAAESTIDALVSAMVAHG